MKSIEVFISYHQKDEELREELERHLATLLREQTITSWHKREIIAGQEFQDEINKHLKRAGLILLLVSPDFIASDYHWTVEVTRALEQNAAGKARVIPVCSRSVPKVSLNLKASSFQSGTPIVEQKGQSLDLKTSSFHL